MDIIELKDAIDRNAVTTEFMIFLYKDIDYFLPMHYVREIAKNRNIPIRIIDNLSTSRVSDSLSLVFESIEELKVLIIDTFDEDLPYYYDLDDTIIICKSVSKKIKDKVSDFIIEFPAILEWQALDYFELFDLNITREDIEWLYKANGKNLFKTSNDLAKISVFPKEYHKSIFADLKNYDCTIQYSKTVLDLCRDIVFCKKAEILEYLRQQATCDFDPMAMTSLLLGTFKNLLLARDKTISRAEASSFSKQYWHIVNNLHDYHTAPPNAVIKSIITFLSTIDLRLKQSKLDLSREQLVSYIINNVVTLIDNVK